MTQKPKPLQSIKVDGPIPAHLARSIIEETLRAAILDGRLPCGTALRQQDLADLFGVSRMPVREALRQLEAQALLAGIVLDTKNFSVRTGSRTFESAAYLRKAGADPVEVKKLFQTDLDDTLTRYRVVQAARLYRGELAIACLDETITRTIAAARNSSPM